MNPLAQTSPTTQGGRRAAAYHTHTPAQKWHSGGSPTRRPWCPLLIIMYLRFIMRRSLGDRNIEKHSPIAEPKPPVAFPFYPPITPSPIPLIACLLHTARSNEGREEATDARLRPPTPSPPRVAPRTIPCTLELQATQALPSPHPWLSPTTPTIGDLGCAAGVAARGRRGAGCSLLIGRVRKQKISLPQLFSTLKKKGEDGEPSED